MRGRALVWAALGAAVLVGCKAADDALEIGDEPVMVAGDEMDPAVLKRGEFAYMRWCAGCHGRRGRGDGPRARGAALPPPDFRERSWRHLRPEREGLPSNEALAALVRGGIEGSIMPPLPVADDDLEPLVSYVKYLATR
jgi:mono/diheme cytochrome c family protein